MEKKLKKLKEILMERRQKDADFMIVDSVEIPDKTVDLYTLSQCCADINCNVLTGPTVNLSIRIMVQTNRVTIRKTAEIPTANSSTTDRWGETIF